MEFQYQTTGVCAKTITFDIDGDVIRNVSFAGGCNGNLKAISILVEGMTVDEIEKKLKGNRCGQKESSCTDQLANAVRAAYEAQKNAQ